MLCKFYIIICGPTAIGKTQLGIQLAQRLNGEIISADSRQIYRYMDIGTAKPTQTQLAMVPHHLIDILNPDQTYSAGHFAKEALNIIEQLHQQAKTPVVVGGSGLYLQALVNGLHGSEEVNQAVRSALETDLQELGLDQLYRRLARLDPWAHARLDSRDRTRILRALEMVHTGQAQHRHWATTSAGGHPPFKPLLFGLTTNRAQLYQRIDARVDAMVKKGLLTEVEGLKQRGYDLQTSALNTFGYRELMAYLTGDSSLDEAFESIKKQTRNYAKRQWTWFRRDRRIRWFDLDHLAIKGIEKRIIEELKWRKNDPDRQDIFAVDS